MCTYIWAKYFCQLVSLQFGIDLMSMGVKIAIEPFEFLTEPSGVGCKGLIVRFTKNAVQSYIFHQKISKNKRSCYKNIQRKCRRHLRPAGSGNTSHFGLPHCPPNMDTYGHRLVIFVILSICSKIMDQRHKNTKGSSTKFQDPGSRSCSLHC